MTRPRGLSLGDHARRRLGLVAVALLALTAPAAQAAAGRPLLAPLTDTRALALPAVDPEVPSPAEVLGYSLGERFSRHHQITAYLQVLAAASPRVELHQYGESHRHQPLWLAVLATPETLARLPEILRQRELLGDPGRLTAAQRERLLSEAPTVVWLGYGVHGNEPASAEAALATAYLLAAGQEGVAEALEGLVVLIDPTLNPDGRERYLEAFQSRRGASPNPDPDAAEHYQPWPGGRGNHYLVDLNRDWAWGTQRETRDRLAAFRRWEPQVYVDFHEMSVDATYFFPPPADPVHPAISPRARRALEAFGRANAEAFDRLGWSYYVGEDFDLFYPAYGDTYPTLRGGIGMTYEVGGHGRAGLTIELPGSGVVTLADRIARHLTTSLTTVQTAARERRSLLEGFVDARLEAAGQPPTFFLWRPDQPEATALAAALVRHGIGVARLDQGARLQARPLTGGARRPVELPAESWAVSTAQPLGTLVRTLMEREAEIPAPFLERQRQRVDAHLDPEFFDITAWSLPLAFNVEVWVGGADLPPSRPWDGAPSVEEPRVVGSAEALGWLARPQGIAGYAFAAALQRQRIPYRLALEPLVAGGRPFPAGSLFVPRGALGDRAPEVAALAAGAGVEIVAVASARTEEGIHLGSRRMVPIRPPRIALLGGAATRPTSFGFLWNLLDELVNAPHTVLDSSSLEEVRLSRYDVLILPAGTRYAEELGDRGSERLHRWLEEGGTLVAVGEAATWLAEAGLAELSVNAPSQETRADGEGVTPGEEPIWPTQLHTPGAIVATRLASHPLTVGPPAPPPVLFSGSTFWNPTGDPRRDLLTVRQQQPVLAGHAWPEAQDRLAGSLLMTTQSRGRGRVVLLAQEPAFRLFWRGTMPLILEAILHGPSLQGEELAGRAGAALGSQDALDAGR